MIMHKLKMKNSKTKERLRFKSQKMKDYKMRMQKLRYANMVIIYHFITKKCTKILKEML